MPPYFIAVHAGAGYHGHNREPAYKAAMCSALQAAADALDNGETSMDAVKAAICALEDAPITNAGYGSNLTLEGSVECDASIMAGDGTFAAVGAMPGVDNPIAAAHRLAELTKVPLPCGLVRPVLLVGEAARRWAIGQGLPGAVDAQLAGQRLASPAAAATWHEYRNMLAAAQRGEGATAACHGTMCTQSSAAAPPDHHTAQAVDNQQQQQHNRLTQQPAPKQRRLEQAAPSQCGGRCVQQLVPATAGQQQQQRHVQAALSPPAQPPPTAALGDVYDTVGCVIVDWRGCAAAGVSSGGLAMKPEGRVGEAAVAGAGCWAADVSQVPGVAVSVSGVGERIMAATLAKATAMQLQVTAGQQLEPLLVQLLDTLLLSQPGPWDAGVLAVRADSSSSNAQGDGSGSSDGCSSPHSSSSGGSQLRHAAATHLSEQQQQLPSGKHKPAGSFYAVGQQQQQQQRRLRVELIIAFTSQSFAVGWLDPLHQGQPHVELLRQHGPQRLAAGSAGALGDTTWASAAGDAVRPSVKCLEFSCSWPCELPAL